MVLTVKSSRGSTVSDKSDPSSPKASSPTKTISGSTLASPQSPTQPAKSTEDDDDEEVNKQVPGWPKVAMLMAETPDFASVPRFRDLNMKNLLYYQVELTRLRKKLFDMEWRDNKDGDELVSKYAKRADFLIDSQEDENHEQWDLILKIRVLLKEYNEALLQYSQVSALPEPETCNMKTFKTWLRHRGAGNFCIEGDSDEQNTWGNIYKNEPPAPSLKQQFLHVLRDLVWPKAAPRSKDTLNLVVPIPPKKIDGFTRWVATEFMPFWHEFRKKENSDDPEKSTTSKPIKSLSTYSEASILKFTSAVSTVVACLLPTIAIVVLSKVHGTNNVLLCLSGFAALFAIGLIFLTSGTTSRVDIFTATAAFSAVLVVFISVPVVVVS